ncbi:uncharacterized protein [Montipora capricornis]|uniref:uncharacterized protein n=1 Tax=Montipora capricornis TaxID=246305 RepID=UPI0035F151BF
MSVESILSTLKTVLSPLDFSHIRSSIEAKTSKIQDRLSSKLERKFNNLKRRYGIPQVSNLSYDSVIFNYSHRALTEAEKMVLARGLRFCLPPKAVDGVSVKCAFEMLYRDLIGLGHSLTSEDQDRLKCQLKNASYSYIYSYDYSKQKRILSKEEWMALNDLRNDTSIIITKPDKGNGVVIVNRHDYLSKMKQLISDGTKFKLLSHNPTKSRENSLISYLRNLKRDCIIDEATFRKILPCGSTAGVLYGLPKVHKTGCPFRPIVSSVNTYNYNLASFLVDVLKPISTNQFTIKNSFSFVDWVKTLQHNNEIMCSFDVCSLFTNVPLDETIEICLSKLYSLPDPPALPRHVLKTLLEFATKKSHFVFDGHYYDQIDGVAMGSPLGPVLANIFMCDFEQKWLANVDSRPSIWFRYVDDTFSLFDSEATAASFLHFLNTRHPNIKFTMELEENQEIPFLDVRIKRNLNNFTTTGFKIDQGKNTPGRALVILNAENGKAISELLEGSWLSRHPSDPANERKEAGDEYDEEGVLKFDSSSNDEDSEELSLGNENNEADNDVGDIPFVDCKVNFLLGTASRFGRTIPFNYRIISKAIATIY